MSDRKRPIAERDTARADEDDRRPTPEEVWREAFMVLLQNYSTEIAGGEADLALDEYLERWSR